MAISPNTDFSAGAILTATQQNQFPRGVMQFVQTTGTTVATGTEAVVLTLPSFTAVANRYYRITYFEPYFETLATNVEISLRIRLTNLTGTVQGRGQTFISGLNAEGQCIATVVKTLTAGSTVLVATIQTTGGSCNAYGDATYPRQLWVEDIGPA
jgi:hypothetical protein